MHAPRPRLPVLAITSIALLALLAQAWTLGLPFQLDDYVLLDQPQQLFALLRAQRAQGGEGAAAMLRPVLWQWWSAIAALAPERSAFAYHACALALHAWVSVLLAACVTRLCGARVNAQRPWLAGWIAGLAFATQTGAIQALSWTAANGDLLFPWLGLIALYALLVARGESQFDPSAGLSVSKPQEPASCATPARSSAAALWTLRGLAVLALLAAPFAKEPALILLPMLALLLAGSAAPRRTRALELGLLALVGLGVLALRARILGEFALRYEQTQAPGPAGWLHALRTGLGALRQALYPWNRDAAFEDLAPWFGRHRLGALALGCASGLALLAAWRSPRARWPLALALAALALAVLPAGVVALESTTNVLARASYLPWLLVAAAIGLAAAALLDGDRLARALAALGLLGLAASAVDARAHVVATERAAAELVSSLDLALQDARDEQLRAGSALPLAALATLGEPGLGGVPVFNASISARYRAPFAPRSADATAARAAVEVHARTGELELLIDLPEVELGARDLVWIAPRGDVQGLRGSALRSARALRARAPLARGLAASSAREPFEQTGRDPARYAPRAPLPAHEIAALELAFAPGPAASAEFEWKRAAQSGVLHIALPSSGSVRRFSVEPWRSLADWFGPPLEECTQRAGPPLAFLPNRTQCARIEALAPADGARVIVDERTGPSFELRLPADACAPLAIALELELESPAGRVLLASERELPASTVAVLRFELDSLGLWSPLGAPAEIPWKAFAAERLLPRLALRAEPVVRARWRACLRAGLGGPRVALGAWRGLSFAARESPGGT